MKQPTLSAKLTAPILLFKYFWGFSYAYAIAARLDTFPLSLPLIYFPFDKMIRRGFFGSLVWACFFWETSKRKRKFDRLVPGWIPNIRKKEANLKAAVVTGNERILSEITKLENIYLRHEKTKQKRKKKKTIMNA